MQALRQIDPEAAAEPAFASIVSPHEDSEVRASAAEVLGHVHTEQALTTLLRAVYESAIEAGFPHAWPHALRKACGQWLVSRVLSHGDTRITELVYCRVSDDQLWDRMLDAIDPRYAQRATDGPGERKHVPTLTSLPAPKGFRLQVALVGV